MGTVGPGVDNTCTASRDHGTKEEREIGDSLDIDHVKWSTNMALQPEGMCSFYVKNRGEEGGCYIHRLWSTEMLEVFGGEQTSRPVVSEMHIMGPAQLLNCPNFRACMTLKCF